MAPLLHGEWGEVKTLAIGTVEKSDPEGEAHARDLSYFSRTADHQSFGRLATVETHLWAPPVPQRCVRWWTGPSGGRAS